MSSIPFVTHVFLLGVPTAVVLVAILVHLLGGRRGR